MQYNGGKKLVGGDKHKKKFLYTRHMRKRMVKRKITTKQVEDAVESPDHYEIDEDGNDLAYRRYGSRALCVVYEENRKRDIFDYHMVGHTNELKQIEIKKLSLKLENKIKMQIDYDPQADAIYIELRASEVNSTRKVTKNLLVDLDEEEMPIGIEILSVRSFLAQKDILTLSLNIEEPSMSNGSVLASERYLVKT